VLLVERHNRGIENGNGNVRNLKRLKTFDRSEVGVENGIVWSGITRKLAALEVGIGKKRLASIDGDGTAARKFELNLKKRVFGEAAKRNNLVVVDDHGRVAGGCENDSDNLRVVFFCFGVAVAGNNRRVYPVNNVDCEFIAK